MSTWYATSSRDWTFGAGQVAGHGGGIGPYLASYAIDRESGPVLNGHVTADLRILDRPQSGGGLVCRGDGEWTFVAFYVVRDGSQPDAARARISVFSEGRYLPVAVSPEPVELPRGYSRFVLEFYSGQVRGEVSGGGRAFELSALCPHVPFPGFAGLVKFYGATVLARHFAVQRSQLPPKTVRRTANEFDFDVFLCHSTKDAAEVQKLAQALKERGVAYWLDAERIDPGDQITVQIEKGLRRSRYVIPCLSPDLAASGWSRAEYGAVLNAELSGSSKRVVIPLVLGEQDDEDIPLLLRDKRRITYQNKIEFEELVKFILRD